MDVSLTDPAKLLLLASILSKDRIITLNGKAFLKELILGQDPRLKEVIEAFDSNDGKDTSFVGVVQKLIDGEAMKLYDQLFSECSLERGKTTSKKEREEKGLNQQKSLIYVSQAGRQAGRQSLPHGRTEIRSYGWVGLC